MEVIKNTDYDPANSIIIDAHLLKTYRACQQKFNYFSEQNIVAKSLAAAPSFGIAFHEGIASYRNSKKVGIKYQEAKQTAMEDFLKAYKRYMPPENMNEAMLDDKRGPKNGLRLLGGYIDHYEPMGIKFHHVEIPFALWLGKIEEKDLIYVGIIDAVLEHHSIISINDIKTTGWIMNQSWLEKFKMDQGLLGYVIAARMLLNAQTNSATVHGVWIQSEPKTQTSRTKKLDDYFVTGEYYWDEEQIDEWHNNVIRTVEEIESKRVNKQWIMDFGQNCGAFNGCEYFSLCSSTPKIRGKIIDIDFQRAIWTPLEDERLQKIES